MITITNLSKGFTQRTLFKDVTLSIFPNEKIGLTGPNGSGKTTLFSIILGEMESSGGAIQIQKNLSIGFLPQEAKFHSEQTVLEEVTSGDQRIKELLKEKNELEQANKADSGRYGDILEQLEQLGIYDLEHKAEKVLSGLGFSDKQFHQPVKQLSGGWQMRTLLAKLLIYPYDLLLLDEPTNYLDLAATLWLKNFLSGYQGTFVIISHDKVFLSDVTNYTILLENGQMTKVKGNYQSYEEQKAVDERSLEKMKKVIDKRRDQLERFTQRFHAQPNRASAVRNKRKMLERLEEIELPQERKSIKDFEFPVAQESGYTVVTCCQISKRYGEKKIYQNLDLEITRRQKVCLVGPNGAGKSTLLKMLAGVLPPDEGRIKLGHQVTQGYFSQTRLDVLNPNRTVLEELASAVQGSLPTVKLRSLLGLFNFHGEDVFKSVQVLSGGEKSRLILAKLLVSPPNFILLDEPTTHLDLDGVGALTRAFKEYQGTLCFISHDLFFIGEVADTMMEVDQGEIKNYPGGLSYYLLKKSQGETLGSRAEQKVKEEKQEQKREAKKAWESQNSRHEELGNQHRAALQRLKNIKVEIQEFEQLRKELETESYVKSRVLANSYGKDPETIKDYGRRLKEIPKQMREIDTKISGLLQERDQISKI